VPKKKILGIDAGGTFTDFVLLQECDDETELKIHKVLSTPAAPEIAILQGIKDLQLDSAITNGNLEIIHGSTVATNAALEGKGASTAFITNHGFGDMLTLGRQTRPALYQLEFPPQSPPVKPEYCIEIGGRLAADGTILDPLLESEIEQACHAVSTLKPEAVAINLLFSFVDDQFEESIEAAINSLGLSVFVCRSSIVLPEYKEYERGIATWLNASLGPVVSGYINRLRAAVGDCRLLIMQSSGETVDAETATGRAVNLLLSGPAAGLAAIDNLGQELPSAKFLSFDMGGTSTDVALIDGALQITNEGRIANYPVAVPMVDMHTIGAGGGSIAHVDAGGMLQVGPQSAGADPGPACYDRGGTEITVTDANLILGRLKPGFSLAGDFSLCLDSAKQAIEPLSVALGLSAEDIAKGIIEVANEHMASALRLISVQRGYDPASFTLASFGGAGGLHVCALADAMGMTKAIIPAHAGVLSALGMLVAPRGRQFSRTVNLLCNQAEEQELNLSFQQLIDTGLAELSHEGLTKESLISELSVDLCYAGQASTLNVHWQGKEQALSGFHQLHKERYGFSLKRDIEFVNLRARIISKQPIPNINQTKIQSTCNKIEDELVYAQGNDVSVYKRDRLTLDQIVDGPAIIIELTATTYVASGWHGKVDKSGNLWLELSN
jgi:N-methylhydantoinase A